MGTSKGYIPPTKLEWSKAKRSISTFLRKRDLNSKSNVVVRYSEAIYKWFGKGVNDTIFGRSFSSAVENVVTFAGEVKENGLEKTLYKFGRNDLIGKSPEIIIQELLYMFTSHGSSIEDSLALSALTSAFETLNIENIEDFNSLDLDLFLLEVIIAFVKNDFDFRYYEKISQGRTPKDTLNILEEVHGYIDGILRTKLTNTSIGDIDFANIGTNKIVFFILKDAYDTFINIYGEEA